MKEALFWKKEKDKVRCELCPHNCLISKGKRGICKARENKNNKLYALTYGKPCALHVDPIEKKPLYHFLPGEDALSIGTAGCNLSCEHCQNYNISQASVENVPYQNVVPEKVVEIAVKNNYKLIAYTYTEPVIFYEYMLDIARLAKKKGIKNVIVSNGYVNEKPLLKLIKYIDAANIDFKSINEEFYKKICGAKLKPILNTLKILRKNNVWLELTNLVIPTLNDKEEDIDKLCKWIMKNLGKDVPLHFSAFYPTYKLTDLPRTSIEILNKARNITLKNGLKYVYIGNVPSDAENTYCYHCKKLLIKRRGFGVTQNNIKDNKCKFCGKKVVGVWK